LKGTINKEVPSGGMAAFANVEVAAEHRVVAKRRHGGAQSLSWNWQALGNWLVIGPNAKRRVIAPQPCFAFTLHDAPSKHGASGETPPPRRHRRTVP
jgi:hypothetical protein